MITALSSLFWILFMVSPFITVLCLYFLLEIAIRRHDNLPEHPTLMTCLWWLLEALLITFPIVNVITLIVILIYKFTQIKY